MIASVFRSTTQMVTFRSLFGDIKRSRGDLQAYTGGINMMIMFIYLAVLLLLAPVASGARFNSVSHIDQQQVNYFNKRCDEGLCA
jgi:hypothetical protein